MSERRSSRRTKVKAVNYGKEQVFSDDEDLFEDSPSEEPERKRGRPKGSGRKSTSRAPAAVEPDVLVDGVYRPIKPIYTEKGYDPSLPSIRERFQFLPEYEPDGSPRIELIVGRRPIDEKGAEANGDSDSDNENMNPTDDEEDSDSGAGGRKGPKRGKRGANKKSSPSKKDEKKSQSGTVEYEYLVKYKGRSYLHLEWKTGADLESMNKSAKTLYRRYLKKLATGHDDDLEDPEFDASYAVPQKICAEEEQEITLELSDKELLEWEKQREKELAEEDSEDDSETEGKANGEKPKGQDDKKEIADKSKESSEEKKGMFQRLLAVRCVLEGVTNVNCQFRHRRRERGCRRLERRRHRL
jgi:hypothetical protein